MALEGVKSEQTDENNVITQETKTNGTDHRTSKQIDPNTAFLRAARAGQLDTIKDLLDTAAVKDINTCNSNGLNALHLAAKDGHITVVEELLKRGAIVDAATKKGNTALHISCLAGQEEVARSLLAAGAKANAQSTAGFTPLYMAAQEDHAGCVKMLLAAGANQGLSTEDGFTPLAVAMQQGHDRVVAELLESDTRGKVRLPALHIAAKKDDVKAASLLLENDHNPDACSKSGFTPLHIAAHYGNTAVAKVLLAKGGSVNHAAKHSITPLHVASKWGQQSMVDLLIENGANISAMTRDGLTPLHCAARSGHENVVTRLIQQGAPITSKTKNGLTPLHMSVQGEHVESAKILLTAGAPIDDVTVDYLTALHVAAHCGHVKVAKLLLDKNADANARALNGFTPLHIACKKNRLKVVELLLKYGASISSTTESGLTPLHVAAFMGCMNIAIHLLQHGASPDTPTARGETPLHLAARAQQTDLIRILLRNGAQVDAMAREEQTPLHVAARLGHSDIAALLLQHGANPSAQTKDAYTPLHIAAKEGKEEVAAILLDHGAPIEAQTRKGFTPLHLVSKYGNTNVAALLVKNGANIDAQGKNNITPLHMATYYGHPDIVFLLLDKGASPHALAKNGHSALHIACRHNHPDIAFSLLEHGADPAVKSKAGFTPLHMASQEGHEDCTEMLVERGADINVRATNGLTPLHLAALEGRCTVVKTLLQAGADVGNRTLEGYTPLHAAAHRGQNNAAKMLIDAGADLKATTSCGYTPLHQAAQQGHTLVIHLLIKNKADPNAVTANGQTACAIADRLGYIGVVEALKPVTENTLSQAVGDSGATDGKYRVAAPELMQDTFMSDSEDEGGEVECPVAQQQQYRYMATEVGTLGRPRPMEDSVVDGHLWPSNNDHKPVIDRQPVDIGFLVSFVVDARGGAMRARRRGGARLVVPPAACPQPTRVTCRAATRGGRSAMAAPPPLMEGEALASRPLELSPQGAKFLAPVVIEVPIFASQCKEREIVVLRSDTGETWQDHYLHNNDNQMIQESIVRERLEGPDESSQEGGRVTRIITCDFPHYFAVISRVKQEVHIIGPDGGTISSSAIPQVQALFPPQALTKKIRVGLQAHPVDLNLVKKLLGRAVTVSPVLTVEPRRRKFHRSITLTMPLPPGYVAQNQSSTPTSSSTLRLLCSIMGGQSSAVWEDVTGSTALTLTNDCVSFTTTVSARFWLIDCRNIAEATKMATELYREMLFVPFEARLIVLGKRVDLMEGKLMVLYLTDHRTYETLLQQEHYTEIATSTSVQLLDGKTVFLEFSGNLVPVTKSGHQLQFKFEAFKDNRCEFTVRVKHQEENSEGRIYFMNEPKVSKGEQSPTPVCVLDVELPKNVAPRAGKSHLEFLNLDQSGFDALKDELSHWGDVSNHRSIPGAPLANVTMNDSLHISEKDLSNGDIGHKDEKTEKDLRNATAVNKNIFITNGDTLTVDSNKTKATFDSDDDKTPFSTLEKNKKLQSSDLIINDVTENVKNTVLDGPTVKDASQEKDLSKHDNERSRSPSIIKEELLGKMNDMFSNLSQPKHSDEIDEGDKSVYQTKLIIEENDYDIPKNLNKGINNYEGNLYENAKIVNNSVQIENVSDIKGKLNDTASNLQSEINERRTGLNLNMKALQSDIYANKTDLDENLRETYEVASKEVDDIVNDAQKVVSDRIGTVNETADYVDRSLHRIKEDTRQGIETVRNDVNDRFNDFKAEKNRIASDLDNEKNDVLTIVENQKEEISSNLSGAQDCVAKAEERLIAEADTLISDTSSAADQMFGFGKTTSNTNANVKASKGLIEAEAANTSSPGKKSKNQPSGIPKLKKKGKK